MVLCFTNFFVWIQFLGRDKDDGVRRSAVSGKKVLNVSLCFCAVMGSGVVMLNMFLLFL